jgi:hypothetical protein
LRKRWKKNINENKELKKLNGVMTEINIKCKVCKETAKSLIVVKGFSVSLCLEHVKSLENYLGQEIEPITTFSSLFIFNRL